MKFWQLTSVLRGEIAKIRSVAEHEREWGYVAEWLDNLQNIVDMQDRAKLDKELPIELVRAALRSSRLKFYLSQEGILRSRRHSFGDRVLSALQAFERFGGEVLEDVLEYGSVGP